MDDRGTDRLRVMTWNLWWHFGEEWRERGVAVQRTLEESPSSRISCYACPPST